MVFSRDKVIRWSGRSIASKLPSSRGDEKFRKALQRDVSGLIRVSCWLILVDVGWWLVRGSIHHYPDLSNFYWGYLGISKADPLRESHSVEKSSCADHGEIEKDQVWRGWQAADFFSEIFKYRLVDKLPLLPFQHDLEPSKNEWILLWSYP